MCDAHTQLESSRKGEGNSQLCIIASLSAITFFNAVVKNYSQLDLRDLFICEWQFA